jgi:hypothetical protein
MLCRVQETTTINVASDVTIVHDWGRIIRSLTSFESIDWLGERSPWAGLQRSMGD